ncbi:phosphoribosyltransferase family protein [Asanoa sp. NPDC049573]|uniref:phosphoribosyltransferase family protein n=1 Tax=Asanoa sp. NPDC049573 TaxID=3155396 RepID=UPI003440BA11
MDSYEVGIGELRRRLPIRELNSRTRIAYVQLHGDIELCETAARALAKRAAGPCDMIVAPESKAIPLAHEVARLIDRPYIVLRKADKQYMDAAMTEPVQAFTSRTREGLCLDAADAERLREMRVWIVDDVVTTGSTMRAARRLVERAGGAVVDQLAIFKEGTLSVSDRVSVLAELPIFQSPTPMQAESFVDSGFHHNALKLRDEWPTVYTALSKHSFCYRVFVTKYVLDGQRVPLNPAMNFDFAFHGLSEKSEVITANNNLIRLADEVWVFGPISDGVLAEILIAEELGKPVRFHRVGFEVAEISRDDCDYEDDVAPYVRKSDLTVS